ncbi:MAG: hypothetical protein ACRD0Y_06690 [Terriglobales bacterium]
MTALRKLIAPLISMFRRRRLDRDIADELASHVALRAEANRAAGMGAAAALPAANNVPLRHAQMKGAARLWAGLRPTARRRADRLCLAARLCDISKHGGDTVLAAGLAIRG